MIGQCLDAQALETLIHDSPTNILENVVMQFSKILPHDANARRSFVISGGLKRIQELHVDKGTELQEAISGIISCFPEDVVQYYSPGYQESLLERIETFKV